MIKELLFLFKINRGIKYQKGMTSALLSILILVIVILVGVVLITQFSGLAESNSNGLLSFSKGAIGVTND